MRKGGEVYSSPLDEMMWDEERGGGTVYSSPLDGMMWDEERGGVLLTTGWDDVG